MKQALLIIDVQNDYFPGGKSELHNALKTLDNIEKILAWFRQKQLPVIHVQHINTYEGAAFFLPETEGTCIHNRLTPIKGENLITKHAPNSFLGTNLEAILRENDITNLVICGMMSHMCIDTTVRACMDHGIKVTLPEDACTTKNLMWQGEQIPAEVVHNTFMAALNGMFANVTKTREVSHGSASTAFESV